MRYPAPNYIVQPPIAKASSAKTTVYVGVCVAVFIVICVIAIALGVGLGLGLKKDSSTSSSSLSTTVNCDYNSSTCGCAAVKPTSLSTKIINGNTATAHSWPWIVALYYAGSFRCGGVLAESYQIVITAAHCVDGIDQSLVLFYAGVQTRSSRANAQVRSVSNWQIHPSYSSTSTSVLYDIAVIKLTSSFNKTDDVGLCCLPSSGTSLPTLNELAVIIGWGDTISGVSTSLSDDLLQGVIQIQGSSSYCDASSTSNIQFCAGYGTTDTCQGDSGGPLMTSVNNLWTCTGIVSSGIGCGHSAYYTRVSYFRSFIDNATSYL